MKKIQFKNNILLTKDSYIMGGMLGLNGDIAHAIVVHRGVKNSMGDITLLCNSKGEPKLIGDQNTEGYNINCKNCISKLKTQKGIIKVH